MLLGISARQRTPIISQETLVEVNRAAEGVLESLRISRAAEQTNLMSSIYVPT